MDETNPAADSIGTGVGAAAITLESASPKSLRGVGTAAILVLLTLQVVLLITVLRTNNEVADLRDQISAGIPGSGQLTDLGSGQASAGPSSVAPAGGSPQPAGGNLPRFLGGGSDPALGRNVGDIASLEYYSGENTVLAAAAGKSRAYMVWAHWCPYCQEELPVMAQWQAANGAELENFELVSVTSAMDETASNPLIPYLDENDFPFPVLVDQNGSLARQLGVNAFPFWVFVAPDGTVVGRATGAIAADELASVFEQLNDLAVTE